MIDYASIVLDLPHKTIPSGKVVSLDSDGVFEYATDKAVQFEGSYSSKIVLRSQGVVDRLGRSTQLFFNGNPSKFLQGHNVFGSSNLKELLYGCFRFIHRSSLLEFDFFSCLASLGSARVVRVDYTKSIKFNARNHVRAYIKSVSQFAHTRSGRPLQKQWTLAFNPSSRRWNVIVYSKGDEFDRHKPHPDFEHYEYVSSEADKLCRVELRLRSKELSELGTNTVSDLTPELLEQYYSDYIGRINMSEQIELTSDVLMDLPKATRAAFLSWKAGISIQAEMSNATYYRHRSMLLKLGVDISVPFEDSPDYSVVPLTTAVKGTPYEIPQAAIDKGLVYEYQAPKLTLIK